MWHRLFFHMHTTTGKLSESIGVCVGIIWFAARGTLAPTTTVVQTTIEAPSQKGQRSAVSGQRSAVSEKQVVQTLVPTTDVEYDAKEVIRDDTTKHNAVSYGSGYSHTNHAGHLHGTSEPFGAAPSGTHRAVRYCIGLCYTHQRVAHTLYGASIAGLFRVDRAPNN